MNWIVSIYAALLFFILTPAILVRLPPKGGKYTVAAFHALVFALVFHFTAKMVWQVSRGLEGFQEGVNTTACKNLGDGKGSGLTPPNDGSGGQNCKTLNSNYCKNLEHDGKSKGFYSYNDKTKLCAAATAPGTGATKIAAAKATGKAPVKVASAPGAGASNIATATKTGKATIRTK